MTPTEQIYMAYPRHVGKVAAMKAIDKAAKGLASDARISGLEAKRRLYRATVAYALSPKGSDPIKTHIPHPATWFNRGSYLDDPEEWKQPWDAREVRWQPGIQTTEHTDADVEYFKRKEATHESK